MSDILLNKSITYFGLGDRLDALLIGKMLYDRDKEPVTFHQLRGSFRDFEFLTSLYELEAKIEYPRQKEIKHSTFFEHNSKGFDQKKLLRSVEDFPKIKPYDFNINLPDNFITVQFDGKQRSRTACSKKEIKRIKSFYKDQGYKLITVGGEATNVSLKGSTECIPYIIYYMSKAKLHVGIDSGMMNLAKLVMPCSNMHIYTSDSDDFKSSILCRCEEKGTKINYSRNL